MREALRQVRTVCRFRIGLVLVAGTALAFERFVAHINIAPVVFVVVAAYALESYLFTIWACRQRSVEALARVQCLNYGCDLLVMVFMAHYTSPFSPLVPLSFMLVVVYASMTLETGTSVLVALIVCAAYCGITTHEFNRLVLVLPPYLVPSPDLLLRYCIGTIAIFMITSTTLNFFAQLLRRKTRQLERANLRLRAVASQLRRHQQHLEQAVGERTRDLEQAYQDLQLAHQELQRMDLLKMAFLANVSHELRTPLTSIRSFSEILRSYPDQDANSQREFLDIIIAECDRLGRLINDLLDLSRIESGHMAWDLHPLDLVAAVTGCVRSLQPLAEDQGLYLALDVPESLPGVLADDDRLAQVLGNLLGNSLKFTREGGITVTLQAGEQAARVSVADTGCGVPEDELGRLFDKFYQVSDGPAGKPQGTGLGLAICKEIVEHHGGCIWAEPNSPHGLVMRFELPYAQVPLPEPSAWPALRAQEVSR